MQSEMHFLQAGNRLRIQAVTPEILRITYTAAEEFSTKKSLMLVDAAQSRCELTQDNQDPQCFTAGNIRVHVNEKTLACTYYDANGKRLLRERQDRPRELLPVEVYRYEADSKTAVKQRMTVDGLRVDTSSLAKVLDRTAYHTKLSWEFSETEQIMGLGSHEEGYLSLRGKSRFLYQQNMKACVPFFWSTAGYGILVDSYTDMTFHDDGYGSYLWTDVDDELDYYVIAGDGFDDIIRGYRYLTGKPPIPPRWSFGYCQSKERYQTADEVLSVLREYRARKIPLDLMILDWKTWEGELWGNKIFDKSRFPDPSDMMRQVHGEDAKLMISIWPNMAQGGENQKEMLEKGQLLLDQSTYNAFSEEGQKLYWKQTNEGLFTHGIDAWWCDCTEPFEADWIDSPVKPEPEERQRINVEKAKIYLDPEYMAAYSLEHSKGMYEGQRGASEKRVLNLTRSSYAGQQRYGTVTWSGDISANWRTFEQQIAEGLSFVSSGCPYWTFDIGGFFVKQWRQWFGDGDYENGNADEGYRELFLRWFECGAFLPMFRAHGTDFPREVWQFGEKGELIYDSLVSFIELRYRLLPYIYSLAYAVTVHDQSMMRPVAADFPHDARANVIKDQFLLGSALMICPICHAGETLRSVYLPKDEIWYDFWTGKCVASGEFTAEAPLSRIPVYVRGGSIIPMGPVVQHSGTVIDTPLEIRVYPGHDANFELYDDDGETYAYERGEFGIRTLRWDDAKKALSVEGDIFPGGIYQNKQFVTVVAGEL